MVGRERGRDEDDEREGEAGEERARVTELKRQKERGEEKKEGGSERDWSGKVVVVMRFVRLKGMPGSLLASQAELEGPCWGWGVQASPLLPLAYWSMLGKSEGGGRGQEEEEEEGRF
ncbi:unnamed protein product [Pleuronectes platessa]|uniref:Uncharacterized protein n=1 Tax=Pleuronectes platessa TaxID=8262 RepID=A0A9N7UBF9_PLEPL|nr:unnamed protein product [Pleuronectes platessa]